MTLLLGVVSLGALALGLRWHRRRKFARVTAARLLPEIRELVTSADPKSATEGEPTDAPVYTSEATEIGSLLPPEIVYALETFYGCLADYRSARLEMHQAFAEGSELSLGDRIRAKDRRDRSLKNVLYTGEAAIQKLSRLTV